MDAEGQEEELEAHRVSTRGKEWVAIG